MPTQTCPPPAVAIYVTRKGSGRLRDTKAVTQTPLEFPLNCVLRLGEDILKILPISLKDCYGASSKRSDGHAKKENTVRPSSY